VRAVIILLLCVPLVGCAVTMHGNQSTSGGTTATTTSSQVSGTTQGASYKASFSSGGHPVTPKASGGYVSVSGNSATVLIGVVVLAELVNYLRGVPQPKPLAPGTAISHTCSCYGYQPPQAGEQKTSDEIMVTR
jgi:hypothetical protein